MTLEDKNYFEKMNERCNRRSTKLQEESHLHHIQLNKNGDFSREATAHIWNYKKFAELQIFIEELIETVNIQKNQIKNLQNKLKTNGKKEGNKKSA
ncbi:hypothetical protein [Spongiimicrobium salis]|uniref:hypothetical protein n=1 Tax=Spongiimicrobium salis TaxID=1667022 RepID=UPI00374D79C0